MDLMKVSVMQLIFVMISLHVDDWKYLFKNKVKKKNRIAMIKFISSSIHEPI